MNKKWFSIFICLIFLISSYSVVALNRTNHKNLLINDIETNCYIMLNINDARNVALNLISIGYDVIYDSITENSLELIVSPSELKSLQNIGFEPLIISRGRPFIEIQNERLNNPFSQDVPPGYPDLSGIIDEMYDTQSSYPTICKVFDLTETYEVSPTYEGRHIYAMKISDNVEEDENEPNFLIVSCHHAREIVTPVIALYAIEQLTSEYGSCPDITAAVNDYEIWISPVWNPDGYEYCYYVDNWWRKNRNPPNGVDLNRNYPFGWNSGCSGSNDPYSETYKGTNPASEAETQTMISFSNDRHFAKVIDYHSYGREVLYGYCCHSHPFDSFFYTEAIELSTAAGYGGLIRDPSAEGENYEWQIWRNGTYANLMETHVEFQPSYSSALAEAAQVWSGTLWLLERPISVSGNIVDSITKEPIVTLLNILDVNFFNGEEFISEPRFGRFHLFLPPGIYTLGFSYENYHTQIHEITVTKTSAEKLDIELVRLNEPPNKPSIDGPDNVKVDDECNYIFKASDPDQDDLEYYIKWGDGNIEEWFGPFDSDEEIIINHIWKVNGDFVIEAKVRDIYGEESDFENFQVSVEEKSRSIISKLHLFREQFLRYILNILLQITIAKK